MQRWEIESGPERLSKALECIASIVRSLFRLHLFFLCFSVVCTYLTCSAVCWRINSTTPVLQSFYFVDGDLLRNAATTAQGAGKNPSETTHSTKLWRDLIGDDDFSRVFCCCCCCSSHLSLYSVSFSSSCLDFDLWFDFFEFSPSSLLHNGSDGSSSCDVMWLRRMFFVC